MTIGLGMSRVPDTPENMGRCACGECPSKPDELKSLYCARGASRSTVTRRGCLCEECPVLMDNDLQGAYYCIEGLPA